MVLRGAGVLVGVVVILQSKLVLIRTVVPTRHSSSVAFLLCRTFGSSRPHWRYCSRDFVKKKRGIPFYLYEEACFRLAAGPEGGCQNVMAWQQLAFGLLPLWYYVYDDY